MTVREELHRLVDELDEDEAREALDYLRWVGQEEEVAEDEIERVRAGEAELERGERESWDELRRELDLSAMGST